MISKNFKIFVAGHNGLVGSSVVRRLKYFGFKKIITRTKKELDLRIQKKVQNFFKSNNIDAVINAAGKSEEFTLIILIELILFMTI